MLVLKRRLDDVVLIEHDIEVKVLEIGWGFVRLGFKAPADVKIFREELLLRNREVPPCQPQ